MALYVLTITLSYCTTLNILLNDSILIVEYAVAF